MNIVVDLSPELEADLAAEAAHLGLSLPEYALRLLSSARGLDSAPRTGAEPSAYWQAEGLIGTRPDIQDSPAYAAPCVNKRRERVRTGTMELVDTDVLIDVQRGQPPALAWFSGWLNFQQYRDSWLWNWFRMCGMPGGQTVSPLQIVWPTHVDCARNLIRFAAYHHDTR